jgi:hypothetical protein
MNVYKRIKGKTPPKDKIKGQFMTVLSAICLVLSASGLVKNEYINLGFEIITILCGGKAFYHAQKVLK